MAKTQKELIEQLIKNGSNPVDVDVKNIKVKTFETWSRARLTFAQDVDAYVLQDDNTYQLGKDNVAFVSVFTIVNALRDTDDDWLIDHINENPKSLVILLKNAKLRMVPRMVKAGDILEGNDVPEDHDAIHWYVATIEFSDAARAQITRIADKMLGL